MNTSVGFKNYYLNCSMSSESTGTPTKSCWSQLHTKKMMGCAGELFSEVSRALNLSSSLYLSLLIPFCCLFTVLPAQLGAVPHRCPVPCNGPGKENIYCHLLPHCGKQEVWQVMFPVRKSTQGIGISAISKNSLSNVI